VYLSVYLILKRAYSFPRKRNEKSYFISLQVLAAPEKHPHQELRPLQTFQVNSHAQSHTTRPSPASCLSSPPPRRSARPPSAAALSRPGQSLRSCPLQAAAPPCTWRSRAGAASRPAHSGASRSAAARSVAAAASRNPRRPPWTRSRLSGKESRWGSRCRRSPCRSCRTRRRRTSGKDLSGSPLASSCSTCGRSASSSVYVLLSPSVVLVFVPLMQYYSCPSVEL
jgi:hypothetical protein